MDLINNITLNSYSILFLIIIYMYSIKHQNNVSVSSKLYLITIRVTIALLLIDSFSRLDGKPDTIYPILNYFGNFLVFLLSPLLPSLWFSFVHLQLFSDVNKTKKLIFPLVSINLFHAILVILNLHFGWFYSIGPQNIYQRGPFFLLSAGATILLLLSAALMILLNRNKTNDRYYFSLLFFVVPPAISIVLQIYLYGSSLILNSIVFSILIVFLNIQNKSIYTDHLTGIYNRNMLDKYLKTKIEKCTEKKTFSAIMLDLNEFKGINDTYGHDMGDEALQVTVTILKSSMKSTDFIARYGGDEFWLVLDTSIEHELLEIVNKINMDFKNFNEFDSNTYTLGLSMGYSVYNFDSQMQVFEFQKYLDELMYRSKSKRL